MTASFAYVNDLERIRFTRVPGNQAAATEAVLAKAQDALTTSMRPIRRRCGREPADQFYGNREAGVVDPPGNLWWIAQVIETVPPEELQARFEASQGQVVTAESGRGCCWRRLGSGSPGGGEPVAGSAGFDDLAGEGELVDDGAQRRVGEGAVGADQRPSLSVIRSRDRHGWLPVLTFSGGYRVF